MSSQIGHADFFPCTSNGLDAIGWLEITLLVEDIVSGQKRFVSFADWFASLEQSSGVAKRFAAPLVTNRQNPTSNAALPTWGV